MSLYRHQTTSSNRNETTLGILKFVTSGTPRHPFTGRVVNSFCLPISSSIVFRLRRFDESAKKHKAKQMTEYPRMPLSRVAVLRSNYRLHFAYGLPLYCVFHPLYGQGCFCNSFSNSFNRFSVSLTNASKPSFPFKASNIYLVPFK